jgi:hypothetical protein
MYILVPTDGQKRIIVHERAYPQFRTHNKLLATPGTLGFSRTDACTHTKLITTSSTTIFVYNTIIVLFYYRYIPGGPCLRLFQFSCTASLYQRESGRFWERACVEIKGTDAVAHREAERECDTAACLPARLRLWLAVWMTTRQKRGRACVRVRVRVRARRPGLTKSSSIKDEDDHQRVPGRHRGRRGGAHGRCHHARTHAPTGHRLPWTNQEAARTAAARPSGFFG